MITVTIPDSAITIHYSVGRKLYSYSVWPSTVKFSDPERRIPHWRWATASNDGIESSQQQAEQAARRWIRDGI